MRVSALTAGRSHPSSRFRIRQLIPPLAGLGIDVVESCPLLSQHASLPGRLADVRRRYLAPIAALQVAANIVLRVPAVASARRADLVWVCRAFIPGLNDLGGMLGRPRVLDVDDAIWLSDPLGPPAAARFAGRFDFVIAGNAYIADWYSSYCSNIEIIPTGVDSRVYEPAAAAQRSEWFTIGWMGTSGNFDYLFKLNDAFRRFLADHADARFVLVSDRQPAWWPRGERQYVFRQWKEDDEVGLLQEFDVGLMPLLDNEWTRGKCSFKMLQSMSVGIPVVVSPVGMNREVLQLGQCGLAATTPDDWYDALVALYTNKALRARMGAIGRSIVKSHFDTRIVAGRVAEVFRRVGVK